jgi:hypothetical protein
MFRRSGAATMSTSRVARTTPWAPTASPRTITYSIPEALSAATTRSGSKTGSALIDAPAVREPQRRAARFDHQPDSGAWSQLAMDRDSHGVVPGCGLRSRWRRFDRLGAHDDLK